MSKLSPLLQWFSIILTMAANPFPPIPAAFRSLFINIYELRKTFCHMVNDYQGQNDGVVKKNIEKHSKTQPVGNKGWKEYRNDTSNSSKDTVNENGFWSQLMSCVRALNRILAIPVLLLLTVCWNVLNIRPPERVRKKGSILALLLLVSCIATGANAEVPSNFIAEVDQPVSMTRDLSGAVIRHTEVFFTSMNDRHTFEIVCSYDQMKASNKSRGSGQFKFITCLPNGLNISHAQFNYTGTFKMIVDIKDSDNVIQHIFNLTVVPAESRGSATTVFVYSTSTEKVNKSDDDYWYSIFKGAAAIASVAFVILCGVLLCHFRHKIQEKCCSRTEDADSHDRMIEDDNNSRNASCIV